MFDLNNIDFIKTDEQRGRKSYSFVGLKRKENSERLEFWLPLGFDTFETEITNPTSFSRVKNFFFKMYRTFQTYKVRKLNQLTEEEKTKDRDGVFEFENGFSFVNENNEQVVFYGKLNALDKILEGYDELRISSLEKKQVRSHEIDYSKIHKYMHQAIYLDDDVIYLDEMNIAKSVLIQDSPPIIQLFCFIYTEIKKELEELDSVPDRAFELTDLFKDNYLQPNSSLFTEDTFADTINILKNVFEEIDSKTTYKDEDFWHFYEAIEAFLMGERQEDSNDGVYFGINNFYDIWEDMCQSYMLNPENEYLSQVLSADIKGKLLTRRDLGLSDYFTINPFSLQLNNHTRKRYLKPDLVLIKKLDYGGNKMFDKLFKIKGNKLIEKNNRKIYLHFLSFESNVAQLLPEILLIYNQFLENSLLFQSKNTNTSFKSILAKDLKDFKLEIAQKIQSIPLDRIFDYKPSIIKSGIFVIDYKYMRQSDYEKYNPNSIDEKGENKIKEDIHKQLIYEWTVQQNFENSETTSEFWIPYYSDELDFEASRLDITDSSSNEFKKSQIKVIKINFKTLQENYIKLSNAL
jgi:hypothetical protein